MIATTLSRRLQTSPTEFRERLEDSRRDSLAKELRSIHKEHEGVTGRPRMAAKLAGRLETPQIVAQPTVTQGISTEHPLKPFISESGTIDLKAAVSSLGAERTSGLLWEADVYVTPRVLTFLTTEPETRKDAWGHEYTKEPTQGDWDINDYTSYEWLRAITTPVQQGRTVRKGGREVTYRGQEATVGGGWAISIIKDQLDWLRFAF